MLFVVALVVQLTWFRQILGLGSASFSRTKITVNQCGEKGLNSKLTTTKVQCGIFCSQNLECRRYLFCSSDSSCRLYQDGTDCILSGDSSSCCCYRKNFGCFGATCTCPLGYYGNNCENIVEDCKDANSKGILAGITSGLNPLVNVKPLTSPSKFEVVCRGDRVVVLERHKDCGGGDFNRSYSEYEQGFLDDRMNQWIGLTQMALLLNFRQVHFFLTIYDSGISRCYETMYMDAAISKTALRYYDAQWNLLDAQFSTFDVDHTGSSNCAARYGAGWWYVNTSSCIDFRFPVTSDALWEGVGDCESPYRVVLDVRCDGDRL